MLKKIGNTIPPLSREQLEMMQEDYALTAAERMLIETALYLYHMLDAD